MVDSFFLAQPHHVYGAYIRNKTGMSCIVFKGILRVHCVVSYIGLPFSPPGLAVAIIIILVIVVVTAVVIFLLYYRK